MVVGFFPGLMTLSVDLMIRLIPIKKNITEMVHPVTIPLSRACHDVVMLAENLSLMLL